MAIFGRGRAAEVAQEVVDHLKLIDNVKALQQGQKELADAINRLGHKLNSIEADMKSLKAEIKLEALKEAQSVVWSVQSEFNQRVQDIAVKVGVLENSQVRGDNSVIRQLGRPGVEKIDGHG